MLDKETSNSKILTIMQATISHELRNPLNAIIAINMEKATFYNKLASILNSKVCNPLHIIIMAKEIQTKLMKNHKVHESSAQLMKYLICDLMDYGQIK